MLAGAKALPAVRWHLTQAWKPKLMGSTPTMHSQPKATPLPGCMQIFDLHAHAAAAVLLQHLIDILQAACMLKASSYSFQPLWGTPTYVCGLSIALLHLWCLQVQLLDRPAALRLLMCFAADSAHIATAGVSSQCARHHSSVCCRAQST